MLAKSCKMVPVMVMGYFVSRKTYPAAEYAIAVLLTSGALSPPALRGHDCRHEDSWVVGIGVGVFLFKTYEVNEAPVRDTELLGVCFISAYMVCDSFTSNYQSRVFKQYSVGSITMMVYTNLFSTAFTALGLCLTWELADVSRFVSENPAILPHIFLMAVCSAIGHQPAETRRESPRLAESSRESPRVGESPRSPRVAESRRPPLPAPSRPLVAILHSSSMARRRPALHLSHHQDVRPAGLRNHPDGGPALRRVKEAAGRRLMPWRLVLRCASCSPSLTPLSSSATRSRRRSCCSASAS